jgi:acyl carrier protein
MRRGGPGLFTRDRTQPTIEAAIRRYLVTTILGSVRDPGFGDDDSFMDNGIVDSAGILELQLFVEKTYGIVVLDEELLPDNFDSINKLATYVRAKQRGKR